MIVPRFITMSIVGENLMVLIIGGHFADKQLKKAPQVGQVLTQVEADRMACSRETIPPSATLRTCQKVQ